MWRSFIARPQGLLSRLRRAVGCSYGDTVVAAAALGGTDGRILRRACASAAAEVDGAQSCPRPRRHLYVVLDEMNTGHSVYRLNVDDLDGGDEDAVTGMDRTAPAPLQTKPPPRRLPEPVLRLGYSPLGGGAGAQFKALGSKIVATGYSHNGRITFVYDTKTARLDIGQPPPKKLNCSYYHAAATGNKLYTFDSDGNKPHYLCEQSALGEYDGYDSGHDMMVFTMRGQIMEWAWKTAPTRLPNPNSRHYDQSFVRSYAVHPDGRIIFVSCFVYPTNSKPKRHFTFSIDTEGHESAHRGDWSMPFHGQAHYDPDLDSWAGLRKADGTDGKRLGNLYLCSCDVPDLTGIEGPVEAPAWKMCKEELTFLETPVNDRCPVLVHTGRGRFCLVEVVPAPDKKIGKYLLHVTMFRAKHGKNGELMVTPCRPGHSYLLPNRSVGSASAFWM